MLDWIGKGQKFPEVGGFFSGPIRPGKLGSYSYSLICRSSACLSDPSPSEVRIPEASIQFRKPEDGSRARVSFFATRFPTLETHFLA